MSSFPPPSAPPVVPVEATPPPSPASPSRRLGLWAGVGVLLIALVVGAVFVFRGDDTSTDDAAPASSSASSNNSTEGSANGPSKGAANAFALSLVADTATQTKALQMQMVVDMGAQRLPIDAVIDNDKQLMSMTMDLSAMLPGASKAELIFDIGAKAMYMSTGFLPADQRTGLPAGADYIKMDLAELGALGGQDQALDQVFAQSNPLDVAPLLAQASDTTVVGDEEIDGEAVRHYLVKVDTADVIAKNPDMKQVLEGAGQQIPDTLTYDVWVTADNQLRRLTTETEVDGQQVKTEMTAHALDKAPDIAVPSDDQTIDIMKMLGGATQG